MIARRDSCFAIASMAVAVPARAYECLEEDEVIAWDLRDGPLGIVRTACTPGCYPLDRNEIEVNFRTGDFTLQEKHHVMGAIETAWEAGQDEVLRGAEFEILGVPDSADLIHNDRKITVVREDPTFWTSSPPLAMAGRWITAGPSCNAIGGDIVVNQSPSQIHSVRKKPHEIEPSDDVSGASAAISLGQMLIHEMGHVLGFGHHENGGGTNSVMASASPFGGDGAGQWRIHENDYLGLSDLYPGASSGTNLHLSKYVPETTSHAIPLHTAAEGWAAAVDEPYDPLESAFSEGRWVVLGYQGLCPGDVFLANSPIRLHLTGTQALSGVDLQWYLVDDDAHCPSSPRWVVGTQTWSLAVNGPAVAHPTLVVPMALPAGGYRLCAEVDPLNEVSESAEGSDNVLESDQVLQIPGPPGACD